MNVGLLITRNECGIIDGEPVTVTPIGEQCGIEVLMTGPHWLKLLNGTNWTMEEATEEDIQLYLGWISWFGTRLQQYCPLFTCFLNKLNDEMKHPIWNHISTYQKNLKSLCKLNPDDVLQVDWYSSIK